MFETQYAMDVVALNAMHIYKLSDNTENNCNTTLKFRTQRRNKQNHLA